MKYLIDTNKIIDFMKNKQGTVQELIGLFDDGLAISTLSVAEIIYGAHKSDRPKEEVDKFERFIKESGVKVLDVDKEIAEIYGQIRGELVRKRKPISKKQSFIFDILLAATSIKYQLTIVTSNIKDFKIIPKTKLL